jgi:hypothetical protein
MRQNEVDTTYADTTHRPGKLTKKPLRWTVIDTVLVLLVVIAVAGVVYRAVDFFRNNQYEMQYYVYVTGTQSVNYTVPEQIGEQDDVYLYGTDVRIGYMKAEHVVCSEPDQNGNVTFYGYLTVDQGEMEDGRLSILDGTAYLTSGEDVVICTDRVALSVHVDFIAEQIQEWPADQDTEQ